MTPDDLDRYLKVLTAARVGQADVTFPAAGGGGSVRLAVTFSPAEPELFGMSPGDWKAPARLDATDQDETGPRLAE